MRDLINARSPWPLRMPLADGYQHKSGFRSLFIRSKNRAPLAGGSRDVELHAPSESGPIVTFLFTAQKPFTRNAVAAHLFYHGFDCHLSCPRAARKVLREHLIDDSDFKAQTCACAHSPSPRRRSAVTRTAG